MTIIRTFTDGADRFDVLTGDAYELRFVRGDDRLYMSAGTTVAYMGDGDDYARLSGGTATVYGQGGADRLDIHAGSAAANGGAGDDLFNIFGGSGHDLAGSSGNDRFNILGDGSSVHLNGGDGDDLFVGYSNTVSGALYGGAGNDRFLDFGNHDGQRVVLRGGTGNDFYRLDTRSPAVVDERAGEGTDTIQVGRGISYTLGANVENLSVAGGTSSTQQMTLTGNGLANSIRGSDDYEALFGLGGNDVLDGGGRADVLAGGDGNDRLYGGSGADTLQGDAGNDRLYGGLGADMMGGQAGADIFAYSSAADAPVDPFWNDVDWIYQFDSGDRIDFSAIDANSELSGFQHFDVVMGVGTDAGTIYAQADPAGWGWYFIEGHTDSDGVPDFALLITDDDANGYPPLTIDSFIV